MVRTLLRVLIEPLTVVAAHALGEHDLRPPNGTPLAGLLADPAGLAFRPALDAEDRQLRQDPQKRAERTQKPAVEIPDEDGCDEQRCQHRPEQRRFAVYPEQPERLDVRIDQRIARDDEVRE